MDQQTPTRTEPNQLGWSELLPHRDTLVRYARRRLLDPSLAEDLVHDVFEAVITGRALFCGRSSLRTWLLGVLKHKIVDLVRQRASWTSLEIEDDESGDTHPAVLVCPQPRPDEVATHRELLAHTLARVSRLPQALREAVEMRLLRDEESDIVCATLGLSKTNLFVRLHRARQLLVA